MAYESKREKMVEFFKKDIIPSLPENNLDYYKSINKIAEHLGTMPRIVEDYIQELIKMGQIKEVRWLVATDEQVDAFFKRKLEAEKFVEDVVKGKINEENKDKKDGQGNVGISK